MTNACYIGKVKPKNLRVIKTLPRGVEFREIQHRHLDKICDNLLAETGGGIANLIVIGIGFKNEFSFATCTHIDSQVGKHLLPSFAADILRRRICEDVTIDVLNGEV